MNADKHSCFIGVHRRSSAANNSLPVELIPRPPIRQPVLVRDVLAKQKAVLRRLPQRREIPIALELVRWLVVVLAAVLLVSLLADARQLACELRGMPDAERRNPRVRHRKMV